MNTGLIECPRFGTGELIWFPECGGTIPPCINLPIDCDSEVVMILMYGYNCWLVHKFVLVLVPLPAFADTRLKP